MKFVSTRGKAPSVTISEGLQMGLAPDGGLYVPEKMPRFEPRAFDGLSSMAEVGERLLRPFFEGDPLSAKLREICARAFDFPVPTEKLDASTWMLELFQGPTAAFKDVGARFLAESVRALDEVTGARVPRRVLVATSGDTGGAVAAAFSGKPGVEVLILYPKGKISTRQEKQLTCWADNVRAFAVRGDFDDCQRIVKEAFRDPAWQKGARLLSANSINLGRILPQAVYYARASLEFARREGREAGFIIPSGNVGNATAAVWAREMGLPIRELVLAFNANRAVPDYHESGQWAPAATIATLANAMDVGNPSNMERLFGLYPSVERFRGALRAFSVSDDEIRDAIRAAWREWKRAICPHTAAAARVRTSLGEGPWILVGTAHPAKFETIVEPLIGASVAVPQALAEVLGKPSRSIEIEPRLSALAEKVLAERTAAC